MTDEIEAILAEAAQTLGSEAQVALLNGAAAKLKTSDLKAALSVATRALKISIASEDAHGRAQSLATMGFCYLQTSDYDRALACAEEALHLFKTLNDDAGEADAMKIIGNVYYSFGDAPKALDTFQKSLLLTQSLGDKPQEAAVLNNIGNVHYQLGDYEIALTFFFGSLAIRQSLGDKHGEARSLGNIGNVYETIGDDANALECLFKCLSLHRITGDKHGEGIATGGVGSVYHRLKDYPNALLYHVKSLMLKQATGDRQGESITLCDIGCDYYQLGEYETAASYQSKSLAVAERIGDRYEEAYALCNLAITLLAQKKNADAHLHLLRALDCATALQSKDDLRRIHHALSTCYEKLNKPGEQQWHLKEYERLKHELVGMKAVENVQSLALRFEVEKVMRESGETGETSEDLETLFAALPKVYRMKARAISQSNLKVPLSGAAEVKVEVKTFGQFSVAIGSRKISKEDWQRKKNRDVFKLLLVHYQQAVTVDQFIEYLWRDAAESGRDASRLVMTAVHNVRKVLEPGSDQPSHFITQSDKSYTLDFGSGAEIDFLEFKRLWTAAKKSASAENQFLLHEQAVEHYHSEFLPEDMYEEWSCFEREVLREMYLESLLYIGSAHLSAEKFSEVVSVGRRITESDAINEMGYELMLTALGRQGLHLEARKIYEKCRAAFEKELDAPPPKRFLSLLTAKS